MDRMLRFLSELDKNNNRDWFHAHQPEFLEAKITFEKFVSQMIVRISQFDPHVKGVSASSSIFRIYRDTRFSNDKTPYKTNFGAHMCRGGKNSGDPGYYFHVQPGECFNSAGIYMPSSDKLKLIRREIVNFPDDFKKLIEDPDFVKEYTLSQEDKLKRPPVGFPADFELIEYLKLKNYCPWIPLHDSMLSSPDLLDFVIDRYCRMKPFNDFIYRALEA
jgi:uncharacterized protein (TIGR02453 family)